MPQPVKLSDPVIEQARAAARASDRSMAGQIEHWVRLGRAVEAVLTAAQAAALKQSAGGPATTAADEAERAALLRALRLAATATGHADLGRVLRASDRVRYGTDPDFPGCIVRVAPDGTRTPGHMLERRFVPLGRRDDRAGVSTERARASRRGDA